MSLVVRSTYLNWLIGTSLGLGLWYLNSGSSRILGGFLIALSLLFLLEYAVANLMRKDQSAYFIQMALMFSLFVMALLIAFNPVNGYSNQIANYVFITVTVIGLMWAIFVKPANHQHISFCDWGISPVMYTVWIALLFVMIGYISDRLLAIISILMLLASVIIIETKGYDCFGYYFTLILLTGLFIYWIAPFFSDKFHKQMIQM